VARALDMSGAPNDRNCYFLSNGSI
jgi:hypothetical protein